MVLLVPYDGSRLAAAALARAAEIADRVGDEILVLTVVPPDGADFARERGWLDPGGPLSVDRIRDRLEPEIHDIAPGADLRIEVAETTEWSAFHTDVSRKIREVAHEVDASVVFVGSENAGRVASPVTSVGDPVAEDSGYDVYIVRHAPER